ncbi:MAG: mercuric reductase [Blastomonas fulva]|uniref:mercuric reductase n=1 Tax=Blastomonas fulva TaxID=1550728 RepID=UPI0024E2056A|nr:mercuric reductase [Blastomonas fulva]MDK2757617.1 mercuric reductase [Blastomonas fulva]
MADQPDDQSDKAKLGAAAVLTVGGIGAAFGVAACCALPILLATAGIGTAWLAGIASIAAPYRDIWIVISALSLLISAFLLWRAHQNAVSCGGVAASSPRWLRITLSVGLSVGVTLLAAGILYV